MVRMAAWRIGRSSRSRFRRIDARSHEWWWLPCVRDASCLNGRARLPRAGFAARGSNASPGSVDALGGHQCIQRAALAVGAGHSVQPLADEFGVGLDPARSHLFERLFLVAVVVDPTTL